MREEEEPSWFARGEEQQLPRPDELMPLTQTLITPDLAVAFDITTHAAGGTGAAGGAGAGPGAGGPDINGGGASSAAGSSGGGVGGAGDEPARTLKRPRLVWTPQLHKRFVDAVAHLGIKNAVPKTIMQLMSVDGLTRENVASHLQKYRLYLKRMQGLGGGGAGGSHSSGSAHHHHAPQIGHFHHPAARPLGHYAGAAGPGFDHGFLSRVAPPVGPPGMHHHRMVGVGVGAGIGMMAPSSFADEMDRGAGGSGGRRELTLFPTSGDH